MTPSKAQYRAALPILKILDRVVDAGGTIQAWSAQQIMPHNQPTWHTTQSYATAAWRLGLDRDADGEWFVRASSDTL